MDEPDAHRLVEAGHSLAHRLRDIRFAILLHRAINPQMAADGHR
jgi:hypothetical protein